MQTPVDPLQWPGLCSRQGDKCPLLQGGCCGPHGLQWRTFQRRCASGLRTASGWVVDEDGQLLANQEWSLVTPDGDGRRDLESQVATAADSEPDPHPAGTVPAKLQGRTALSEPQPDGGGRAEETEGAAKPSKN